MNKKILKIILLVGIGQLVAFVGAFTLGKTDALITVLIIGVAFLLICSAIFIAATLLPSKLWLIKFFLKIFAALLLTIIIIMIIATATGQHTVKDNGIYFSL